MIPGHSKIGQEMNRHCERFVNSSRNVEKRANEDERDGDEECQWHSLKKVWFRTIGEDDVSSLASCMHHDRTEAVWYFPKVTLCEAKIGRDNH